MDHIARTNIRDAQEDIYRELMEEESRWVRPDGIVDTDVAHRILVETYIDNPFALLYIDQNIKKIVETTLDKIADAEVEHRQHMENMAHFY